MRMTMQIDMYMLKPLMNVRRPLCVYPLLIVLPQMTPSGYSCLGPAARIINVVMVTLMYLYPKLTISRFNWMRTVHSMSLSLSLLIKCLWQLWVNTWCIIFDVFGNYLKLRVNTWYSIITLQIQTKLLRVKADRRSPHTSRSSRRWRSCRILLDQDVVWSRRAHQMRIISSCTLARRHRSSCVWLSSSCRSWCSCA